MSQTEVWTIKALLDWTIPFLEKKGSESPRLEAEILLAFALGKTRVELYVSYDEVPSEESRNKFRELIRRRSLGEPVAYLVGNKEFYSLSFDVDRRALIPRPETEQLVLEIVEYVKKSDNIFGKEPSADESDSEESDVDESESSQSRAERVERRVCEVGVGSGCVSVALAKHVPNVRVLALDVSEDALAVARANAVKHSVADRIEFLASDLFEAVASASAPFAPPFDIIVSNPPYVSEAEYESLSPTVRNYEPRIALVGGATGAELAFELVAQTAEFLKPRGKLYLELSPTTVEAVADRVAKDARWEAARVFADFARLPRYLEATRK